MYIRPYIKVFMYLIGMQRIGLLRNHSISYRLNLNLYKSCFRYCHRLLCEAFQVLFEVKIFTLELQIFYKPYKHTDIHMDGCMCVCLSSFFFFIKMGNQWLHSADYRLCLSVVVPNRFWCV